MEEKKKFMSNVIRLTKKATKINTFESSVASFKSAEELEKENLQIALHNQYTQGLSEGKDSIKTELQNNFNEKLSKKYSELNNVIAKVNESLVQYEKQFEELIINVAFILSEKILKRELERESIIKDVLDESVKKVLGANDIVVRLNPKDYESVVNEGKSFQLKDSYSKIKFEKDDRIEIGGCLVESEIGNADGRISSQLHEMKRKLNSENSPLIV
jgi:flagellar assembly protein FliH